jgi:hypothetical protein
MLDVIYTSPTGEPLCTTEQAASLLNLSSGYLVSCRSKNSLPLKFTKIGKRVFYRMADINAYRASKAGA